MQNSRPRESRKFLVLTNTRSIGENVLTKNLSIADFFDTSSTDWSLWGPSSFSTSFEIDCLSDSDEIFLSEIVSSSSVFSAGFWPSGICLFLSGGSLANFASSFSLCRDGKIPGRRKARPSLRRRVNSPYDAKPRVTNVPNIGKFNPWRAELKRYCHNVLSSQI